jgi:hypothetical protein
MWNKGFSIWVRPLRKRTPHWFESSAVNSTTHYKRFIEHTMNGLPFILSWLLWSTIWHVSSCEKRILLISDYVSYKQAYKVLWNLYKPCIDNGCQVLLLFHTLQIVINLCYCYGCKTGSFTLNKTKLRGFNSKYWEKYMNIIVSLEAIDN